MTYLFRLLILSGVFLLSACSPAEPPIEATTETDALAADRAALPADQTRGTRNANPETVAPERLPVPVPETAPVAEKTQKQPAKEPEKTAAPSPSKETGERPSAPAPHPSTAPATPPPAAPTPVPAAEQEQPTTTMAQAPTHSAWQTLLKTYVDARGRVNYAGLAKQEKALDAYLGTLAESLPNESWTNNEQLAYWLNAYNAFTFKLVLNNYPLKSITDLDGGDPWKVKWVELDGKVFSLNEIEHEIIRPQFKDPRIHFALVCAAVSCPPLANEAFTARNVRSLLEKRTRQFINNQQFNQLGADPKISKLFDWYGEDFGDVKTYLNKYLDTPVAEDAELGFMEYDWALNKQ